MWNTTSPKFSICMADTWLVWLPATCLTVCLSIKITTLCCNHRSVRSTPTTPSTIDYNYFNIIRLAIACLLATVTVVDLFVSLYQLRYYHQWPAIDDTPPLPLPTVAYIIRTFILIATRLAITIVVYQYRLNGQHSCNWFIWFYLLADTVASGLTVWSYATVRLSITAGQLLAITIEFSLTTLLLMFCSIADRLPQRQQLSAKSADTLTLTNNCPKDSSGFLSLLTFQWVDSLLWTGWQKSLTIGDLWPLRSDDRVDQLMAQFSRHYKTTTTTTSTTTTTTTTGGSSVGVVSSNVFTAILKTFWSTYLPSTLAFIVFDTGVIFSAYLLKYLIEFTVNDDDPQWHGYVYATAILALNMTVAFAYSINAQQMTVLGQRIKTLLTGLVYRKALVLSNSAKNRESNTGQIVNLMAVDCHRFIGLLSKLNFLWTTIIQITLAVYLLYTELGVSIVAGILVLLVAMMTNIFVAKINDNYMSRQMSHKDRRQLITNDVLNGIKVLKLYAWEKAFIDKILQIRGKELGFLRTAGYWSTISLLTSTCLPFMVTLATFGSYMAIGSDTLDAQKVFVSLALFAKVGHSVMNMPDTINEIIISIVSINRLNKFLDLPELTNYVTNNIDTIDDEKEDEDDNHLTVLSIENGFFTWNSMETIPNNNNNNNDNII
ncbi:multidrug resistance-associated protein 1-like, partial [Oppia nitens]|uniref:multidrug resistance-associated protein 1-like n=1 Tax=Oppia nitens TaxID=1686743 RepID=UPI0023DC76FE